MQSTIMDEYINDNYSCYVHIIDANKKQKFIQLMGYLVLFLPKIAFKLSVNGISIEMMAPNTLFLYNIEFPASWFCEYVYSCSTEETIWVFDLYKLYWFLDTSTSETSMSFLSNELTPNLIEIHFSESYYEIENLDNGKPIERYNLKYNGEFNLSFLCNQYQLTELLNNNNADNDYIKVEYTHDKRLLINDIQIDNININQPSSPFITFYLSEHIRSLPFCINSDFECECICVNITMDFPILFEIHMQDYLLFNIYIVPETVHRDYSFNNLINMFDNVAL